MSWINYAEVIEANFAPFVEKCCPEPEKLLTLFKEFQMETQSVSGQILVPHNGKRRLILLGYCKIIRLVH